MLNTKKIKLINRSIRDFEEVLKSCISNIANNQRYNERISKAYHLIRNGDTQGIKNLEKLIAELPQFDQKKMNSALSTLKQEIDVEIEKRDATIVIHTALYKTESESVKQYLAVDQKWLEIRDIDYNQLYFSNSITYKEKKIKIVLCSQLQMGLVDTSILITKLIKQWKPKLVVHLGIAAGHPKKTQIGDILIASNVFLHDSGKINEDRFVPDNRSIDINPEIIHLVKAAGNKLIQGIRDEYIGEKPKEALNVFTGAIGSGNAIINKVGYFENVLATKRDLIGIDMEAYAVARASKTVGNGNTKFVVIKSVSDHAAKKKHKYRDYAAYTSVAAFNRFCKEFLQSNFN